MGTINAFAKTMLDAGMARLDAGVGNAKLQIFTASYGTLLAEYDADAVAFGAGTTASPSVATMAGLPKTDTALATGTAAAFRWLNGDGTTEIEETGAGAVGTAAAFVILDNVNITVGQTVNLLNATFQMPTTMGLVS